jgi:formylmethanofuran dehydrogenase subunit C
MPVATFGCGQAGMRGGLPRLQGNSDDKLGREMRKGRSSSSATLETMLMPVTGQKCGMRGGDIEISGWAAPTLASTRVEKASR